MRRILLIFSALCLLLCGTAQAAGGAEFRLRGSVPGRDTGVYPVNFVMWTGPGYNYDQIDYELCCDLKTDQVKVFTQVWNGGQLWIMVEATHYQVGKVRGYMVAIDSDGNRVFQYDQDAVPWEDTPSAFGSTWACMCYEDEVMRYGPGEEYAFNGSYFSTDDDGYVVLTDGEWALVEGPSHSAYSNETLHRGWIRFAELIY